MPQGSHKPGVGNSCAHVPSPICRKQQVQPSWGGPARRSDEPSPLVQSAPEALTHAHPPAGTVGTVKGDDDHHTCVITSAISLAYQTFTGPSISIFKPFSPQYTASWFLFSCSETQCVNQDLPTSRHPERRAGPYPQGLLLRDPSLRERTSVSRFLTVRLRATVNWNNHALATR